jgi:putative transposase
MAIVVLRDRQATFDPQLIAEDQRRFPGFDKDRVDLRVRHEHSRDRRASA